MLKTITDEDKSSLMTNIKVKAKRFNDPIAREVVENIFPPMATERQKFESEWILDDAQVAGDFVAEWKEGEINEDRSKVFVNLTQRKILAIQAIIFATEFEKGQIPLGLSPTPVPSGFWSSILSKEQLEEKTRRAYKIILDWTLASGFKAEFAEWLWQLTVNGNAFWKTPVPFIKSKERYVPDERFLAAAQYQGIQIQPNEIPFVRKTMNEIIPTGQCLNIWDCFLDPEARDSQGGIGVIHRPQLRPDQLIELVNSSPLFDRETGIEVATSYDGTVGADIASRGNYDPNKLNIYKRKENINIFEFFGRLKGEILLDPNNKFYDNFKEKIDPKNNKKQTYECKIIIADDKTIYAGLNETGSRPIHNATWVKRAFNTWGFGIPKKMRDMQSITNGLTRAYIDGKRFSSVPFGMVNYENLADGETLSIYPGKIFKVDIDEASSKLKDVFSFERVPDTGESLSGILAFSIDQANEDSNIPKQMEGQYASRETTATEVTIAAQGANAQLSSALGKVDRFLLEPHWRALYDYLMSDPNLKHAHADMDVKATGHQTFIERTVTYNSLIGILQTAFQTNDPQILKRLKIHNIFKKILVSQNIDPEDAIMSDKEFEEEQYKAMVMQEKAAIDARRQDYENVEKKKQEKRMREMNLTGDDAEMVRVMNEQG